MDQVIAHTVRRRQAATSSDEVTDYESLLGGLRDLKSISITTAVGNLGHRFDIPHQTDARSFLREAYRARSQLLHDGTWPLNESIRKVRFDLWLAVGDILRSILREKGLETKWGLNIGKSSADSR